MKSIFEFYYIEGIDGDMARKWKIFFAMSLFMFIFATNIFVFGFRFMFYSNDHLPVHIHIIKDGHEAKYNVEPIEQVYNHGFKRHDILLIESVIEENKDVIINRWKEYFKEK